MKPTFIRRLAPILLVPVLATAFMAPPYEAPADPIPMLDAEIFGLDGAHSYLGFSIGFLGLNKIRGTFENYDLALLNNEEDPTRLSVTLIIDVASINTGLGMRDKDLRSTRFFDVETHPHIIFQSEHIEATDDGYVMHGPLTMHGITKQIAVPFTKTVDRLEDPAWGNVRVGFEGRLTLNRRDFDILGNDFWGNKVLADNVDIEFSVLGIRSNFERWGFNSREKPSIGDTLMTTMQTQGLDATLALYHDVRERQADAYNTSPRELDLVGRKLLQQGRTAAALAFFNLAVEAAPDVVHFHTVLGEAFAMKGDREATLRHFQKAFSLAPDDPAAIEVLRRLGKPIDASMIAEAVAHKAKAEEERTVTVSQAVLAHYVGDYELQPGFVITITLEGDQLIAQATGQDPATLHAVSESRFFLKDTPIEIEFNRNDAGVTENLTLFQGGQEMLAKKIK